MRILVIGAGGMLGVKLIARLAQDRGIGKHQVTHLTRVDAVPCVGMVADFDVETVACDISAPGIADRLMEIGRASCRERV